MLGELVELLLSLLSLFQSANVNKQTKHEMKAQLYGRSALKSQMKTFLWKNPEKRDEEEIQTK